MKLSDIPVFAAQYSKQLREDGVELHPVQATSKKIATKFWGAAWMRHLATCEQTGLYLAPGRSLLRHGAVIDFCIEEGKIAAKVAGEYLYDVELSMEPLDEEQGEALAQLCSGELASLLALLEGKLSDRLIQQLFDPDLGLLPQSQDWKMSCSCEDWAEPCCHAAAVLYATGVALDADPAKLFELRGLKMESLLANDALVAPLDVDMETLSKTFHIDF